MADSDIQIDINDYLNRVKEQRNSAMDSAAQAWALVDLKDQEISRLNRIVERIQESEPDDS